MLIKKVSSAGPEPLRLVVQIIVQVLSSIVIVHSVLIFTAHRVAAVVSIVELRVVAVLNTAGFFPPRVVDLEPVVRKNRTV